MKIIEKDFNPEIHYDPKTIWGQEAPLFIDIETTGLSSRMAQVYLIGVCHPSETGWHFCQWFADRPEEEPQILEAARKYADSFTLFIHFNGNHFDIPFLRDRSRRFHQDAGWENFASLDLYLKIKNCRTLCGMENCRQKTIESFLGMNREDLYNGGQLISIYHSYVSNHNPELLHLLLLHNEEDVMSMPALPSMLSYTKVLNSDYQLLSVSPVEESFPDAETEENTSGLLTFSAETDLYFPRELAVSSGNMQLLLKDHCIYLQIPALKGSLRHYFPDYKNYWYLPAEHTCIHKNIAAFVDASSKEKASAENCYITRKGTYYLQGFTDEQSLFTTCYQGPLMASWPSPRLQEDLYLKRFISYWLRESM